MAHQAAPRASVAPTRRALLRATAWSLPVVAVATAAPAYASSEGGAVFAASTTVILSAASATTTSRGVNHTITGVMTVENPTDVTTQALRVELTLDDFDFVGNKPPRAGATNGNWIASVASGSTGPVVVSLLAETQLAPRSSTRVDFTIEAKFRNPNRAHPIHARPAAANLPAAAAVSFATGA